METLLHIFIAWVLLSIPVSLIIGSMLASKSDDQTGGDKSLPSSRRSRALPNSVRQLTVGRLGKVTFPT